MRRTEMTAWVIAFLTQQKRTSNIISDELFELWINILKEEEKLVALGNAIDAENLDEIARIIHEFKLSTFHIPIQKSNPTEQDFRIYHLYLEVISKVKSPRIIHCMLKAGFPKQILRACFSINEQDEQLKILIAMYPLSWQQWQQQAKNDCLQPFYDYVFCISSEMSETYIDKIIITACLLLVLYLAVVELDNKSLSEKMLRNDGLLLALSVNAILSREFARNFYYKPNDNSKLTILGQILRIPIIWCIKEILVANNLVSFLSVAILASYSFLYSMYVVPFLNFLASNYNIEEYMSYDYANARKELANQTSQPKMVLYSYERVKDKNAEFFNLEAVDLEYLQQSAMKLTAT